MTCERILDQLRTEFEGWTCSKHDSCSKIELANRSLGMQVREEFLRKYPISEKSSPIDRTLVDRESVHEFLVRLIYKLRPLGGIQAVRPGPSASKAARNLGGLHDFLKLAVDPKANLAQRIDAWDDPSAVNQNYLYEWPFQALLPVSSPRRRAESDRSNGR